MLSNFIQMPAFLKFLTGMAAVCVLSVILSILPGYIDIFGQHVSTSEWWSNGSGSVFAVSLVPIFCSWILMLKRSVYGRVMHIAGWISAYIGVLMVAIINNVKVPQTLAYMYAAFAIASVIVFAGYLYFSKRARAYFA